MYPIYAEFSSGRGPFLVLLIFLAFSCSIVHGGFNLTLLHTADTFSALSAVDDYSGSCIPRLVNNTSFYESPNGVSCYGGAPRMLTLIKQERARTNNHTLLVDAGNAISATLYYYVHGVELIGRYYARLGYDAVHWQVQDFVLEFENVVKFMQEAQRNLPSMQFVASNLEGFNSDPRAANTTIARYAIKTFDGNERVGFAATLASNIAAQIYAQNVSATEEAAALLVAVAALNNKGVNKVIASVSSNATAEIVLSKVPGIDVLIVPNQMQANDDDGIHSGRVGSYPMVVQTAWEQPVLIVSSGTFGRQMGVLNLEFDDFGVITSWSGDSVVMDDSIEPDPELHADLVQQYTALQANFSQVVGWTAINLTFETNCLFSECAIGNWMSDATRTFATRTYGSRVQIAFNNGGSVRASFPAGPVTLGQEQQAFPFGTDNLLYTYRLQGRYVFEALENGVSLATDTNLDVNSGAGKFLIPAGVRFTWNPEEAVGMRVVDAYVEVTDGNWQLLDMNQMYTVSSFDWLVIYGGDDYTMIQQNAVGVFPNGNNMNAVLLDSLAHNVTKVEMGRVTTTSATRRTCIASDGSTCSGNGYCLAGVCQCTVPGTGGTLCTVGASSSSSDTTNLAIALGISLPIAALLLLILLIAAIVIFVRLNRRRDDNNWEIDMGELEMGHQLGAGGFGQVYKATWKGTEVAVKVVSAQSVNRAAWDVFKQEVSVMTSLRHPNVVLFMAACTKPPTMCIVMELMELGSLYELLHNELVPAIPLPLCLKMAYQAAKGMHFLHSSGIVHRDLKSLNLLLDSKWNLKVSDFGLTKFRTDLKRAAGDDLQGTIHWTAPEVLEDLPEVDYVPADVYSFGVIMWELLSREEPYAGMTPAAIAVGVIRDGIRPTPLDSIPNAQRMVEFENMMAECWHQEPAMRPSFLEIMSRLSAMTSDFGESNNSTGMSSGSSSSLYGGSFNKQSTSGSSNGSSSSSRSSTLHSGSEVNKEAPISQGLAHGAPPTDSDLTVVFTDVAEAGMLWEAEPKAMREAMTLHNDLLRKHLRQHHGYESVFLKNHAGGEGYFCFIFTQPANALKWCEEIQQKLLQVDWPKSLLNTQAAGEEQGEQDVIYRGLRVRMGVHHGPVSRKRDPVSNRFEYFGVAVSVAMELTLRADGGHVLVSSSVTSALDSSSPAGKKTDFGPTKFHRLGTIKVAPSERTGDRRAKGGSLIEVEVNDMRLQGLEDRCQWSADEGEGADASGSSHEGENDLLQRRDELSFIGSSNACRWIIPFDDIKINDTTIVGQGSYGFVSKGRWKGIDVAVKRFPKQRIDEETMLRFREESALLAELRHPNVVLFIGACMRAPNICIVTEWITKGSLRTVLADNSIKLSWSVRLGIVKGIALGLAYLHSQSPPILHRDLKSSNVLVDESWNAKLADFGLARIKQENATMTQCGTPAWTAPEVVKRERYTEQADIYSLGVVMWEVATRKVPFAGENMAKIAMGVVEGKRPTVPSNVPRAYAALISSCWHRKLHKRPSAEQVCHTIEGLMDASSSITSDTLV